MKNVPQEVADFINATKSWRIPFHAEGQYQEYKDSKLAACWGNNGLETENYFVSVCAPSPLSHGDKAFLFFDFKKK